jgi:hypothetical protein
MPPPASWAKANIGINMSSKSAKVLVIKDFFFIFGSPPFVLIKRWAAFSAG